MYAHQLIVKVDVSIINSDKLSCSYDDMYLCITFLGTQCRISWIRLVTECHKM